ncbi:ABC transporter ATP-binding protein [Actinoallomurus bryophytorum]|nr:ABC transporter ATP-binding protein [Actinoallomurus bryophytorum]
MTLFAMVRRDLFRGNPVLAAVAVVASVVTVVCQLIMPSALGAVAEALSGRLPITHPVIVLAVVLFTAPVATALADQAAALISAAATRRHRTALLRHALQLSPRDAEFSDGELLTRFSADAEAPGQFIDVGVSLLIGLSAGIGGLVALSLIGWWLTVLLLAEMATSLIFVRVFVRHSGAAERRYQAARGDLATRLVDAHQGIRTIRACGTRDRESRRILAPLAELRAAGKASWTSQRQVTWHLGLLVPAQQIVLLIVLGVSLLAWRMELGQAVAALTYSAYVLGMLDYTDTLVMMTRYAENVRRLAAVLTRPVPEPAAHPPRPLPPDGRGEIRFEGVLSGVNLTVAAGSHVAVVGRSGAGKSLLAGLVGRLAEAETGRVLLDGVDVADVAPRLLRREVTYAFELPRLFGDSVRAAISSGTDADAEAAARQARADGFIRMLPGGYDTPLARAPLSGGELQRLGLARALARPARVLVLDDATSSLDTATEAEIRHAIRHAWDGRTALIVAHRPGTADAADLVAWLYEGRLRALRPHAELWQDPQYRAIFQGQGEGR